MHMTMVAQFTSNMMQLVKQSVVAGKLNNELKQFLK